jgi:hypothetical protein
VVPGRRQPDPPEDEPLLSEEEMAPRPGLFSRPCSATGIALFFLAFNVFGLLWYVAGAMPDRHTDHPGVHGYVTVACEEYAGESGATCRGTFRSDDGGMVIDHVEFRVARADRDGATVEAWATGTLPEDVHPQGEVDGDAADNLDDATLVVVYEAVIALATGGLVVRCRRVRRRRPA